MSSGLNLALLTLNLTQTDFNRMNRDNLKKYIEDFFKQEYVQKDFERHKIAVKILLENKPRVEEENRSVRQTIDENQYTKNNFFSNPYFSNPFSIFNNHFSTMMNEIDNLHQNFGNVNIKDNYASSNMVNTNSSNMVNTNSSNMVNTNSSNMGNTNSSNMVNTNSSNMVNTNSSNMVNTSNNSNGFTRSYSRTYVNNNGNGYIKEESMEKNNDGIPKIKSFYKKIENGNYVEEPNKTSKKLLE